MQRSCDAIGIDLGTTYSRVAVFEKGKAIIVSNSEGNEKTPSEVCFDKNEQFVGNAAQNRKHIHPTNTIFNIKRLIGRTKDDPKLLSDIELLPFHVSPEPKPVVEVDFEEVRQKFVPEEITAMILQKMKDTAEKYLKHPVKDAVITVPAFFDNRQRQATKNAAIIAGLNVLNLINGTTAAALTYGLYNDISRSQNVLFFDIGGGKTDVTIVRISNLNFEVKATSGDSNLGGTDFDQRLLEHFSAEFNSKTGVDITGSKREMETLRTACETTKIALSTTLETTIEVYSFFEESDFVSRIHRDTFERLCENLFSRALDCVKRAVRKAKIEESEIDQVVLVGGSTRIPKIQKLLEEYFDRKILNHSINPDEAVARGAVEHAAILSGVKFRLSGTFFPRDVTPWNYLVIVNGRQRALIDSNTKIPFQKSEVFDIPTKERHINVEVYGEKQLLASFYRELTEIKERARIEVVTKLEIDSNGILAVTVKEKDSNKLFPLIEEECTLNDRSIEEMAEKAENHRRKSEARDRFEQYVCKVRNIIEYEKERFTEPELETLITAVDKISSSMENEENATREIYESKLESLAKICAPIIIKPDEKTSQDFFYCEKANSSCREQKNLNPRRNGNTVKVHKSVTAEEKEKSEYWECLSSCSNGLSNLLKIHGDSKNEEIIVMEQFLDEEIAWSKENSEKKEDFKKRRKALRKKWDLFIRKYNNS